MSKPRDPTAGSGPYLICFWSLWTLVSLELIQNRNRRFHKYKFGKKIQEQKILASSRDKPDRLGVFMFASWDAPLQMNLGRGWLVSEDMIDLSGLYGLVTLL